MRQKHPKGLGDDSSGHAGSGSGGSGSGSAHASNPSFAITSGGTALATGTGMKLRSSIRVVGNPVVQTGGGIKLYSGIQGIGRAAP